MFSSSTLIAALVVISALIGGSLNAGTVQGQVKGPDGKAISGAEVQIAQTRAPAAALQKVKTDQNGAYVFKNLVDKQSYILTAWVNKVPTAIIGNVIPRAEGSIRIDLDINANGRAKKAKLYVFVEGTTGSHLGGRWVEVDEYGRLPAPGLPIGTIDGDQLKRIYRGSGFGSHSGSPARP